MKKEMYYLDTSAILGYHSLEREERKYAEKVLDLVNGSEFCTSTYSILEMYTTVSRKEKFELPFLSEKVSFEAKIKAAIKYYLRELDISVVPDKKGLEQIRPKDVEIEIWDNYKEGIELAPSIRLTSRDILHLSHASLISKREDLQGIVSIDENFEKARDKINKYIGLKIVTPFS